MRRRKHLLFAGVLSQNDPCILSGMWLKTYDIHALDSFMIVEQNLAA